MSDGTSFFSCNIIQYSCLNRANTLNEDIFFKTMKRSTSAKYLHLAYAILPCAAPAQENRNTLDAIARTVRPTDALLEQGQFFVQKFGHRTIEQDEISRMPIALLWAGSPPEKTTNKCAMCHGPAKRTCSNCRLMKYCDRQCQIA